MQILVVGGGGREHALCWKLAQSAKSPTIYCAPGNAGTATIATNVNLRADDVDALLKFAAEKRIDLTVVGPEDPLCRGIVDRFEAAGLRIFGPSAAAARLEGDKAYAKKLMRECGVPTAEARVFGPTEQELAYRKQPGRERDESFPDSFKRGYQLACEYVESRDAGLVVKAAGLAKGKGVFVHEDPSEALATLKSLMVDLELGEAGERVVIEELLTGPEVSVMALVDGFSIYVLESASDHKRLGERDTGPNTGGMGAYSPSDTLTEEALEVVVRDVFVPIVDRLNREGVVYRGVLYAGLMLTAAGPKTLEFNCRFGDPETQPVLARMQGDLLNALEATVDGRLDQIEIQWDRRSAVCVVMASQGYPKEFERGKQIVGLEEASSMESVHVFHAGTAQHEGEVVTAGGRVLSVTGIGDTLERARSRAYEATKLIQFDGAYLRGDIAMRISGK